MSPSLICDRCTQRTSPTPLFTVKVVVKDSTSQTTFTLFEKYVRMIIKVSTEHLLNNDKNASQDVIPPVLNNIMGRTYVFKLTLNEKNTVQKLKGYTVTDVLEEMTNEDPVPVAPKTVDQSQEINLDNAEQLKDGIQKKRKLQMQEQNSSISDATKKHEPDLQATSDNNNNAESGHPTPPAVPHSTTTTGNDDAERRDKRQK
ncbi:hypothetical protein POM88_048764 [Heracleum sosnowskyi]|uniref:Replication factor A C-terminal domain-containing protein n=1 Tax=Heracleum sosnowskyi TaxID=360622 RepID=A0AAD8GVV2_9APIA|nr:hypothetical protein POM88_048764 [Heracleum sosnowskyi]